MKTQSLTQPAISPAPWRVCEPYTNRAVFPIGYLRPNGATLIIAEVNSQGGTPDQQRANAELIAQAPQLLAQRDALLAACKAALQCQLSPLDENTVDTLEAAIALCSQAR